MIPPRAHLQAWTLKRVLGLMGVGGLLACCGLGIVRADVRSEIFNPSSPTRPPLLDGIPVTDFPPFTPTLTPYPITECRPDKTCIRWFVGLGSGTDLKQILAQEEIVKDFNASQAKIQLVLKVFSYGYSHDALSTEIASGNGPDIIGPVSWGGEHDYSSQWLDLGPYLAAHQFDLSLFDPALLRFYRTEAGQVGLPSAIYPSGMFFVPSVFDESGLAYPPQKYGDKYRMPDGTLVDWNWDTVEAIARLLTIDRNGKNSTEDGFDRTQIVQVGYMAQWQDPITWATYEGGPSRFYNGDKQGDYIAAIPGAWKKAWKRHYQAIWGDQPWMLIGPLANSLEFGSGNVFNSGRAAMALAPIWYTCCLSNFAAGENKFQVGTIPMGAEGVVYSRMNTEAFHIWKGTRHPEEAVEALIYLITTGGDKLLLTYGALPTITSKQAAFFKQKSKDYPYVTPTSWDVFKAGLIYPVRSSAEGYLPNFDEAISRLRTFGQRLDNTPPNQLDFDAEFQRLEDDLTLIFNK